MKNMKVILNGVCIDTILGASISGAKNWIKKNLTYTHMGEWSKFPQGFEYSTTIGRYYSFEIVEAAKTDYTLKQRLG